MKRIVQMKKSVLALAIIIFLGLYGLAPAQAAPVVPLSYDMLNGDGQAHGGGYNYWDKFYTGTGNTTTDRAPLSGGLGDLTDGVIPVQNWVNVENTAGTGPYVGWNLNPIITFHFGGTVTINTVYLSVDDSDGYGGVSLPSSVDVVMGSNSQNFVIFDPSTSNPLTIPLSLSGWSGDTLSLTLNRNFGWVFCSEVQFDGVAVPLPHAVLLFGSGLLGLAGWRRFRRG